MAARHMVLVEEARAVHGRAVFMLHEYLFGTDHTFSLACQPPAEFGVLAVHEKRFVEEPFVIDQFFTKQKATAGEIVKTKVPRI